MTRLFGTDGIRGVAYQSPLDRQTVGRIGRTPGFETITEGGSARIFARRCALVSPS